MGVVEGTLGGGWGGSYDANVLCLFRLVKVPLLQLDFPGENNPNFP